MTALYCVILAGGLGSGLWPLSRQMHPKQILKTQDGTTLFRNTFLRVASVVDDKKIITATNVKHVSDIKEQLKNIQDKFYREKAYKTITEPDVKNTAPALALAVKYIKEIKTFSKEAPVVLAVPSDQYIPDRETFAEIVEKGVELAKSGYIVTFSSKSNVINGQYGYIKTRKNAKISDIQPMALKVSSFVEKPSPKEAKELLKGQCFVNTGIYMFGADVFLSELQKYAKEIYNLLKNEHISDQIPSVPLKVYEKMPVISIDKAIMENSKKLVTLPFEPKWQDIGSWDAVYDISKKDKNGNYTAGNVIDIDSKNSLIYSTSKLVATMGLKDTVVVETEDALLVCDRKKPEGVKNIYKKLNAKNATTKESHKTVYRPWGCYTVLEEGEGFLSKCIAVNPDAKLSLQKHFHRSEHWIVLEGEATVVKGNDIYTLSAGESIDIGIEEVHSLQNFGKEQLKVLEIQQGDILDENDIVRLQDIYGRV